MHDHEGMPLTTSTSQPSLHDKWRALPRSWWSMLCFPPEMEARWGREQVRRQKFMVRLCAATVLAYQVGNAIQTVDVIEKGEWLCLVGLMIVEAATCTALTLHPRISYYHLEVICALGTLFLVVMITLLISVRMKGMPKGVILGHAKGVVQEDEVAMLSRSTEAFFMLIQALIIVGFHAGAMVRARRSWLVTLGSVIFVVAIEAAEVLYYSENFLVYRLNHSGVDVWAVAADSAAGIDEMSLFLKLLLGLQLFTYIVLGTICWFGQCLQETAQRTAFERMVALEVANEAQRREAAAQHKRDRDLAATIFHEVRNPLNGVVAHLRLASLLKREAATSATATAAAGWGGGGGGGGGIGLDEHISGALGSAEVAIEFLNTLTQVEKLEASAATLHPTRQNLSTLLERSADVARPQLQPGVVLRTELPPAALVVLVDGTVLTQVLINLLSNAARHTSHGAVTLACVPIGAERFRFSVTDTGSGVANDIKDNLFDRYRSIGGVGLGLHLTFRQVKSMGATIEVESPVLAANDGSQLNGNGDAAHVDGAVASTEQRPQQGPGTRFRFVIELPIVAVNEKGGAGAEATNGGGGALANGTAEGRPAAVARNGAATNGTAEKAPLPEGLRVLVSDDVKTNRKLLRAAFERHCAASWSVSEARNGEEAVAMCEATPFDLVVMDEVFEVQGSADGPDQRLMRGSEAIAQIRRGEAERARRDPAAAARPACIISCSGNNADTDYVTPTGADLVWIKPFPDFTNGEMQSQLSKLLARRPAAPE